MKIAVVVDSEGKTSTFYDDSIVKVYERENEKWKIKGEMLFHSDKITKPIDVKNNLMQVNNWLGDCKLIVVKELKGTYFTFFEGRYFTIWEMEGDPKGYLDYVYESELLEKKKQSIQKKPIAPEETRPGIYYINLKEVMSDKNSLTSKQILIPFFRDTKFDQIIIDCDHIPRWFEKEFPDMKLKAEAQKFRDGMKVIVSPAM